MTSAPFRGLEPGATVVIPPHPKHGREELAYVYDDAAGRPLFYVCRYRTEVDGEVGKTFAQGHPNGGGSWSWNLRGLTPVLYRLPDVIEHLRANDEHAPLYIVEGEKDADRLNAYLAEHELAGVATTCPMGAGKWRDTYTETLHGCRSIIVIADNDEPGVKSARAIVGALAPYVGRVELMRGAVEAPKADLSDHLDAGLGLDDLVHVDAQLEETPAELAAGPLLMSMRDFAALQVTPPAPLWGTEETALIPEAGLAIFAGRPGVGKTTLVLDLGCHLAAGLPWPPRDPVNERAPEPWPVPRPLNVAVFENEGPVELFRDKAKRKLAVFPHDIEERGGWLGVQVWRWGAFSFADDDAFTKAAVELEERKIDLVIGDPLNMLGVEGVGSPDDTRRFVQRLRMLGLGTTRAFLLLHHFRERVENDEDELRKLSGAWGGHLDSLITLAQGAAAAEARLAFPKLRWARGELPKPVTLGKVYALAGFEALGLEDDIAILEPKLVAALTELRAEGEGYGGKGWQTSTRLAAKIQRKRDDVTKALEGAPHLFTTREGEAARDLGAKRNAKLWGLSAWADLDEHPPAQPELEPEPAQPELDEQPDADGLGWR